MTAVYAYSRTHGGSVIHRASCPYAQAAAPWHAADGKTPAEVRAALAGLGVGTRLCMRCLPRRPGADR